MDALVTTVFFLIALVFVIPVIIFLFKLFLHVGALAGLVGIFTGNIVWGLPILFICLLLFSIFDNDFPASFRRIQVAADLF